MLCAVYDRKDVDLIRLEVVNDSKGAFHDLPDLGDPEFRDLAPRQGERSDLLGASGQPVNNAQGVLRRIPCDVGVNRPEMVARRIRPVDFHFSNPNSARTVSTLVVRPAWLSARPDSMA